MGYERYPRGNDRDDYGRRDGQDDGRDYGSGRSYSYSSARDYDAAGAFGRDRDERGGDRWNQRDDDRGGYGRREYGNAGYAQGGYAQSGSGQGGYGQGGYGQSGYGSGSYGQSGGDRYGSGSRGREFGGSSYGNASYGAGRQDYGRGADQSRYARGDEYHGSYAHDGHRWEDVGARRHWDDDNYRGRQQQSQQGRGYGRQPQGYDYEDRGFLARAGDEVRSWFGDEEAERRREADSRYDERYYNQQGRHERDGDYHNWRSGQIAALDRDYDEYRQENRSKFENEFSSWRSNRQTQRQSLNQVKEHAEVVGSDGSHVGTVDKVRGDRILLTKNDADAGGQHHSIPSSWIQSVEEKKVTLSKTADEAKKQWRDEEQNQALFRYGDNNRDRQSGQYGQSGRYGQAGASTTGTTGTTDADRGSTDLNRSFSGTYDSNKS